MGNMVFDSGEVLAHANGDGATFTKLNGAVIEKELLCNEPFGSVRNAQLWTEGTITGITLDGTTSKVAGRLRVHANLPQVRGIAWQSPNVFNDGVWVVKMRNFVGSRAAFALVVDSTNYIMMYRHTSNQFVWLKTIGGSQTNSTTGTTATDWNIRITRSGNSWTIEYDLLLGAGWQLGWATTAAIGANARLELGAYSVGVTTDIDFDDLVVTGTGIYADLMPDSSAITVSYNTQVADEGAGAIIQFGSASWTEDSNMLYDYQIGTSGKVSGRTSAQITALGDQVTDDGNFQLWSVHGGTYAQASWTSLSVSTVAPSSTSTPSIAPGYCVSLKASGGVGSTTPYGKIR